MNQLVKAEFETAIIGAGLSGLGAAIRLKESGIQNFIIFESAPSVGGTWRDNIYPGCGCDVPTLLYSFSFEQNPTWSRKFPKQSEILKYINHCVDKYGLLEHIRFDSAVKQMAFDESKGFWRVTDQRGQMVTAKAVIPAIGPLSTPIFPKIIGRENFKGVSFHTARWDKKFDPSGKRIAVIGTGASAIQLVPELAKKAKQLYVYQRSPAWILPKRDAESSNFSKKLFQLFPPLLTLLRETNYWLLEFQGKGFFGNNAIVKIAEQLGAIHIKKSISDKNLRAMVLPKHKLGCKRVLLSNDYYPALERPNVQLITEPIKSITTQGVAGEDGQNWEVDAIVYATGFEAAEFNHRGITIIGRQGRNLFEEWKKTGAEALYGMAVSGYPGLLFMLGPNSGLGHNSAIHIMESQINYITDYLKKLKSLPNNEFLDVKPKVQKEFNENIQKKLAGMVWASKCNSWYKTSTGKNTFLWPGHTFTYRRLTKKVNLTDFDKVKPMIGAADLIKSLSEKAFPFTKPEQPKKPSRQEAT